MNDALCNGILGLIYSTRQQGRASLSNDLSIPSSRCRCYALQGLTLLLEELLDIVFILDYSLSDDLSPLLRPISAASLCLGGRG
jgi:hypothetical protein